MQIFTINCYFVELNAMHIVNIGFFITWRHKWHPLVTKCWVYRLSFYPSDIMPGLHCTNKRGPYILEDTVENHGPLPTPKNSNLRTSHSLVWLRRIITGERSEGLTAKEERIHIFFMKPTCISNEPRGNAALAWCSPTPHLFSCPDPLILWPQAQILHQLDMFAAHYLFRWYVVQTRGWNLLNIVLVHFPSLAKGHWSKIQPLVMFSALVHQRLKSTQDFCYNLCHISGIK